MGEREERAREAGRGGEGRGGEGERVREGRGEEEKVRE